MGNPRLKIRIIVAVVLFLAALGGVIFILFSLGILPPKNIEQFATDSRSSLQSARTEPPVTDELARNLFGEYVVLEQTNLAHDPKARAVVLQNALEKQAEVKIVPITYPLSKLSISEEVTVQEYALDINAIFSRHHDRTVESEFAILERIAETQDLSLFAKLEPNQKSYALVVEDLLTVTVPESMKILHLNLLNDIAQLAQGLEGVLKVYTDSLVALQYLDFLLQVQVNFMDSVQQLDAALEANGVIFSQN